MTGGRRHRRRLRLPGACLVLLFAFYAGLAPGTMPAWMNGALTLVLCTGGETVTVTLDENGIPDDTDEFEDLNIDPDFYIPTIQLYFSDDLTIA